MVTESESLLNTKSCVPSGLATTVCALGTLIVAETPPDVIFMTSIAPGAEPFRTAVGTAA
jgi:hypothetical protein